MEEPWGCLGRIGQSSNGWSIELEKGPQATVEAFGGI